MNKIRVRRSLGEVGLKITLCTLISIVSQQFIQAGEPGGYKGPEAHEPSGAPKVDPKVEAQRVAEHNANIDLITRTQQHITDTSWNGNNVKNVNQFDSKTETSTTGNVQNGGSFDMTITKPKTLVDSTTGKKSISQEPVSRIIQDKNGDITVHTLEADGSISKTHKYKSTYDPDGAGDVIKPTQEQVKADKESAKIA